jgi:hypothetical protein
MSKYRIYALIHGETLVEGKLFDCEIKKMDFDEQERRCFSPIQSIFSGFEDNTFHKTYVTSLPYIDPIKIKSEYVIVCNIEESKPDSALGGAIKNIDRIARYLSLVCVEDVKKKFGRNKGNFEPYIYQVNKIYSIDENEDEKETDYKLESGHIYLPNRPEQTQWRSIDTSQFLEDILNFYDETLERSLKYLYHSSIGHFILDNHEKIALDHIKSIEIIINALSNKDSFKEKLKEASKKIGIDEDEQKQILICWDDRSTYGDVAHPSKFDEAERYPNQFPVPSNVRYRGAFCDNIAPSIILKYYNYIKSIYNIDVVEIPSDDTSNIDGSFCKVLTIFPFGVNDQNHLCFTTTEKDKNRLKVKIKKSFIEEFKISDNYYIDINCVQRNKHTNEKRFTIRVCMKP